MRIMGNGSAPQLSTTENPEHWCDIKAAARHIGMSVAFLRKQVRLKRVPHTRIGNKTLRFLLSDLDRWAEQNGCGEIAYSKNSGR